jgi:hypothetical protein
MFVFKEIEEARGKIDIRESPQKKQKKNLSGFVV